MVKKLIIVETGGTIKIKSIELNKYPDWVKDFIVNQTNLCNIHSMFKNHVIIFKKEL